MPHYIVLYYVIVVCLQVRNALGEEMKKAGIDDNPTNAFQFLLDRVKANLHVVLGMSPVGRGIQVHHNQALNSNILWFLI